MTPPRECPRPGCENRIYRDDMDLCFGCLAEVAKQLSALNRDIKLAHEFREWCSEHGHPDPYQ